MLFGAERVCKAFFHTAPLVFQRDAPSPVSTGVKRHLGLTPEYFPPSTSPHHSKTTHSPLLSAVSQPQSDTTSQVTLPSSCSSVSVHINMQGVFWAMAPLISWRHLAAFWFYSEQKVNTDVFGFSSLHPASRVKKFSSDLPKDGSVFSSEQLMNKSLHSILNM